MIFPKTSKMNKEGHLEIGGVDTVKLAKKYGTPLFILDEEALRTNCRQYMQSLASYSNFKVIYANKALSVLGVLKIISSEGLGMDVASGGELYTALKAGCSAEDIYFHGNNKTKDEIIFGLKSKAGAFVVDNFDELSLLTELSTKMKAKANVLFRVNPGVDTHTHAFIKTGATDSKFGIAKDSIVDAVKMTVESKFLTYRGLHSHIGSQIFDKNPYIAEIDVLLRLFLLIKKKLKINSFELNIGGGIGIAYMEKDTPVDIHNFVSKITNSIKEKCRHLDILPPKIVLEPGRSIIGNAVATLYEVGTVKEIKGLKKYAVVDGGMNDNPRYILYGAKYEALLANKAKLKPNETYTIAGRACESGDILIKDVDLPEVEKGDLIAVACTGAYNYSMASNYNKFLKPALVSVKNGKSELLIKREKYEDLVRNEL